MVGVFVGVQAWYGALTEVEGVESGQASKVTQ